MATAASFEPYYPDTAFQLQMFEGDDCSFVKGNLVVIDSAGFIVECSNSAAGTDPASIFGVAAEDANASATAETDGDKVGVYVIMPNSVFSAKSTGTTSQTDVGLTCEVSLASSVWYVDISATGTSKQVTIIGFDPRDEIGYSGGTAGAGGRYFVTFAYDRIQATLS